MNRNFNTYFIIYKTITKKIDKNKKQTMTTSCKKCSLGKHSSKACPITKRKTWTRRTPPPHSGKPKFWEGVYTRTQIANQTEKMKLLKKNLKEKEEEIKKINDNSEKCVICQDKCLESIENSTPCGHVFHTGCLLGWLKTNNTCPCCRASLYEKPKVPDLGYIESIAEAAIRLHLTVGPNDDEDITINSSLLYNVGDDIGRLVVEDLLDIELDWVIGDFGEDPVLEDNVEELSAYLSDEESYAEYSDPNLSPTQDNGEEKVQVAEIIIPYVNVSFNDEIDIPNWRQSEYSRIEPQDLMVEVSEFREWFRYQGVMNELKSRQSFYTAWNNIDSST